MSGPAARSSVAVAGPTPAAGPGIAGRSPSGSPRHLFDDRIYRALRALGLRVRIELDVEDFERFISSTEHPVVNSAADPANHDFAAGEVFWLHLLHGDETVATQVLRIVTTDDYVGMVRNHRLFYGDRPSALRDFRMLPHDAVPRIGGIVVQLSGLYVMPHWRRVRSSDGMRLVAVWARLTHSFASRGLMADWSVSLIEARVATPRMIADLYGYPNSAPLFEAYVPELDRVERVTLVWMSAEELVDSVARHPPPTAQPIPQPGLAG